MAGHVARTGSRINACRIPVEKQGGKRLLGDLDISGTIILKWI
jgi:hypothetical protein